MKIEFTWACYLCQSNVLFVGSPYELTRLITEHMDGHGLVASGVVTNSYDVASSVA